MLAHHLIMDAPENAGAIRKFNERFNQQRGASAAMRKSEP
jgi:hypothetical protein